MGTVFLKNATSSPITVAGYTVHYIDSADAEIVEVEGSGSSSIDVWFYLSGTDSTESKTFSANDYWNSRVIDSTDEQTLRDFGVSLVNIGGDPINYGIDSSNSDFSFAPLGLYSGLRIGDLNADMDNFYVANGRSTWSNRKCIWSRSAYSTPALTWKCRITKNSGGAIKYNAFKFTLNGTPYYYVIDGIHDTWTDDLSAWGYSEVQPVVELPTVILMTYSSNEWNYPASFNTNPLTFVSGEQAQLYIASGTSFSYESDKVYSVGEYQNPSGTTTGRYGFSVVSVNSKIGCKNISGSSITIQRMSVYRCSDSTATVVTVYDGTLVPYNAFKYTANNTDYYYVLDGTQTDWTDDLSAWGYSEVPVGPVLPTVSEAHWLVPVSFSGIATVQPNGVGVCRPNLQTEQPVSYDSSYVYGLIFWKDANNQLAGHTEFACVEADTTNHYLGVKNVSSGALTVYWMQYATCSSSLATVVTVYNSSNTAYNAFKFTANNTDYYYVLDGTQTDWVSDLGSIGYSLYLTAWFNPSKTPEYSYGGQYNLYDSSGNKINADSTKTYTPVAFYESADGQAMSPDGRYNWMMERTGELKIYLETGFTNQRIEYTVS